MRASKSQVRQDCFATAAARHDMIEWECSHLPARGQMAVFAAFAGSGDNRLA